MSPKKSTPKTSIKLILPPSGPSGAHVFNVSVKNLRKIGYKDLKEWIQDEQNIYVGRRNHYVGVSGSKWANPFTVGERYTIKESLELYREHVITSGLIRDIGELLGKNLGCWCVSDTCISCHAVVLVQLMNELIAAGKLDPYVRDSTGFTENEVGDPNSRTGTVEDVLDPRHSFDHRKN